MIREHRFRLTLAAALALTASGLVSTTARAETPHVNYLIHCAGCHLQDGTGKVGEVPDLGQMMGRFATFPEGRAFLVQVPGTSQSPLDNEDTAALLNWMLATFGNTESVEPYTTEEVEGYRATRLSNVRGARAALIEKLEGASGY